jgi:hypothetical protein
VPDCMQRLFLLALLSGVTGCNLIRMGCPGDVNRAIDIAVTDVRTGSWIARGAFGSIQDGSYLDSLRVVGWLGISPNDTLTTLGAGLGRPGRYDVRVVREGYRPWQRSSIWAREGPCGVETTRLRAELEPL